MWSNEELDTLVEWLEPTHHSFTYSYPPLYVVRDHGAPGGVAAMAPSIWPDLSLYLHLPYCRMNCNFCSLHRELVTADSPVAAYVSALAREIAVMADWSQGATVTSLYFGGGTPSMLAAATLEMLLDHVQEHFQLHQDSFEFTLECAPDPKRSAVDWHEYFLRLTDRPQARLSRVSLGLQSWDPSVLTRMGRTAGRQAALDLLEAVDTTVATYNVDFIAGYPMHDGQDFQWEIDHILQGVTALHEHGLRLPSVSVYQLWDIGNLPSTKARFHLLPRAQEIARGLWNLQAGMYALGYTMGAAATFVRAEDHLHRWTKHRLQQFRHLGLGSGAYSLLPDAHVIRDRDIQRYIDVSTQGNLADIDRQLNRGYLLTAADREIRRIITGLRTPDPVDPPDPSAFTGADHDLLDELTEKLTHLKAIGTVQAHADRYRLSDRSFFLTNAVSSYLHPVRVPRLEHSAIAAQ